MEFQLKEYNPLTFCSFSCIVNVTTESATIMNILVFICQSSPVEIPRYGQVRGVGSTPRSTYSNRWLQNGQWSWTVPTYSRVYNTKLDLKVQTIHTNIPWTYQIDKCSNFNSIHTLYKTSHVLPHDYFKVPATCNRLKNLTQKPDYTKIKKIWDSHSHLRTNVWRAVAVCVQMCSLSVAANACRWKRDDDNSHRAS